MSGLRSILCLATALGILGAAPWAAEAGLRDTPLPTFSSGRPAQVAYLFPSIVKNNRVETLVICTNLASQAVDIGLEVFDRTGTRGNSIAADNGAVVGVQPGSTVTIATGKTAVLTEDYVIQLEPPVISLSNGGARVVTSGGEIGCVAFGADSRHRVRDPSTCPQDCEPPPSLVLLPGVEPCSEGSCDDGNTCTDDSCDDIAGCSYQTVSDGTQCDDGDACTEGDTCTSGTCEGTAITCGADRPCNTTEACDPSGGQCVAVTPTSTCISGGGKKTSDCAAEWVVENPGNRKGRRRRRQVCQQGDTTCDFDTDANQCTFRVRLCLNAGDHNLPQCRPSAVSAFALNGPTPRSKKPSQRTSAETILTAVEALATSSRGGKKANGVVFDPPNATADDCTSTFSLSVRQSRTLVLKARTDSTTGPKDRDKLKLKCRKRKKGK